MIAPLSKHRRLRICMIVSNDMTRDSRVDRHARALALRGHEITVLSRASHVTQQRYENRQYYQIVRYFEPLLGPRPTANSNNGPKVDPPSHTSMRLFAKVLNMTRLVALIIAVRLWLYAFAFRLRADVYHCNDLDTFDIGAFMKIAKKKLVYDSHELYVAQIMQNPLRMLYLALEKLFLKVTNVIITVNPFIGNQLRRMYHIKKRIYVVLNCPEMSPHQGLQTPIVNQSNIVTVLYHGGLYADRGLENLIHAARYFRRDVRLLIRGDGELKTKLAQLASGMPHVSFEKSVPMKLVVEAARTRISAFFHTSQPILTISTAHLTSFLSTYKQALRWLQAIYHSFVKSLLETVLD